MDALLKTYITLRRIKGPSEQVIRNVLHSRGTLSGILNAPFEELVQIGFDVSSAQSISEIKDFSFAESEMEKIERMGGKIITLENPDYPALLKEVFDPPLFLNVIGNTDCLKELCIGVVGARRTSRNGEDITYKIARELANCGITIVSGLAYGVDITAHKAAIAADGATAAILGSGLNKIYPADHARYLDQIYEKGCVISELSMDSPPEARNFPRRNRIISGLCKGVLVTEASARSGSLITCRLALEQGRDVFAVPASPAVSNNATNSLIKNGAILTESHLDILQEFRIALNKEIFSEFKFENPIHEKIWKELGVESMSIDEIISCTLLDYKEVTVALATMELENKVNKGIDGRYCQVNA